MNSPIPANKYSHQKSRAGNVELRAELEESEAENRRLQSAQSVALAETHALRAALEAQTAAHEATLGRLHQIESSTIWRATTPLRRILLRVPPRIRVMARRGLKLVWWTVTGQLFERLRTRRHVALPPQPARPAGQPRSVVDATIEYRKATPRGREAALFVTHSPDGKLKPHVIPYVAALRRQGIHVTLIVAADATWFNDDGQALDNVDTLVVRENCGFDFAAWAHVLQLEPDLFGAELLYLLNDSLVGPFNDADFDALLTRLRAYEADVIGMVESREYQWHIQSFFIALRRKTLASPALQRFIGNVKILPTKDDVIQHYEIQFASALRAAGLACAVLFPSKTRSNRTLFDWKALVAEGFPFVKVMALRDPINGVDHSGWRELLRTRGYDVRLAEGAMQANGRSLRSMLPRHLANAAGHAALLFLGPWNFANGLGVASRSYLSALRRTPYQLNLSPIKNAFHIHRRMAPPFDINDFAGPADVAIIHLNPDAWPGLLDGEQRRALMQARLRIGLWVWEMNNIPDNWHPIFDDVDAIWAPSRYCQEVFSAKARVPVHAIPHVVQVPASLPSTDQIHWIKEEIGIKPADRVILYAFDGASYLVRKNPFALVRAFARTRLGRSGWKLVLKTKNLFDSPHQGAHLQQICDGIEGLVLVNRALDHDAMRSIMAMADIYASPHCSEGFGLTVAEAMAMGKIVVATDYSGTRDFLDENSGFPVRYALKTLQDDHGHYTKGNVWAQIDEAHLAESLERAAAMIEAGDTTIGARARARIAEDLSAERVSLLIQQSIETLLSAERRG